MNAPRIACCISGCRRTFKRADGDEAALMCRRHWRTVDPKLRERHKQILRRDRKLDRLHKTGKYDGRILQWAYLATVFSKQVNRAWSRCVDDATIKAAFGVETAKADRELAEGLRT